MSIVQAWIQICTLYLRLDVYMYLYNGDDSCDHDHEVWKSAVVAQTPGDYAERRVAKHTKWSNLDRCFSAMATASSINYMMILKSS